MSKGTASMGRHSRSKSHIICRRCGSHSYHASKRVCSSCGFGADNKQRSYRWSKKEQ